MYEILADEEERLVEILGQMGGFQRNATNESLAVARRLQIEQIGIPPAQWQQLVGTSWSIR